MKIIKKQYVYMLFKPEDDIFKSKLCTEEEKKKQSGNRY